MRHQSEEAVPKRARASSSRVPDWVRAVGTAGSDSPSDGSHAVTSVESLSSSVHRHGLTETERFGA